MKNHRNRMISTRRQFLVQTSLGAAALAMGRATQAAPTEVSPLKVSLAEWTLVRDLRNGKIGHLEFAKVASDHGILAVEYVNQFFMDKAKDSAYLGEMKRRAADLGVTSVLIMCDREGDLGDSDLTKRLKTVDNHRKWIDAATVLGCHSIRVNARSTGAWSEQVKLAADGLGRLTEFGAGQGINVIVENHGGLSSNADWLAEVIATVNHPFCGTLPDTGNFKVNDSESYDSYRGVRKLMKWAKGVSIKDRVWDDRLGASEMDFERMLKIVLDAGYRGYCGIEFGGFAGLNQSRTRIERAIEAITS